jgi:hypothetical protein
VLSKPDTEDMEMCFSEQSSFHLGGNLYLIAEQDGILLTDNNTMKAPSPNRLSSMTAKYSKMHGKLLDLSWVIFP